MLGVSTAAYRPFTSLFDFDSTVLLKEVGDAIDYCKNADGSLIAFYHDFMSSNKIVGFFKFYLPLDQKPGTIALLGCGLAGLWGYGRKRMKK